jgi:membrane-associated protease RseP (regulator of RpoE activity)
VSLGGRDIVEGLVAREHEGPSPALARLLDEWDGLFYWESAPEGRWLVLVRETRRPRERWWLHAALLALTLITTSIAGAALTGVSGVWYRPTVREVFAGLWFSVPLAGILLAHESGHYVAARRYRVNASPPFFIPFPAQINLLGTLGAFIRLRSPLFDRRTLFDIGAAGPLAGILIAVPCLLIGIAHSTPHPELDGFAFAHQYVMFFDTRVWLGDSLLLNAIRLLFGFPGVLALSPLAMAGWAGVLVTALNLLPLAQFDGGHIAYAVFGRGQAWIARFFWLALIPLGRLWWGWWLWAALALLLGRGRLEHPRLIAPERALDPTRRVLGWTTVAIFLLTFMPAPIILLVS